MIANNGREQWGSRIGFILAAAGSAVGLGNIAFFPKTAAENGGGLFVLLYVVAVLVVGVPIMLAELSIGRASQSNAVGSFRKLAPGTKWFSIGGMGVAAGFLILSFYAVIGGWLVGYFWESISGVLTSLEGQAAMEAHFNTVTTDPVFSILFFFIFMTLTVFIVHGGIGEGIERWSKLLMPILLVLMVLVIARGLLIENSMEGMKFLFMPKWEDMSPSTLAAALSQAFFSLSLGMGAMITYGSYLKKNQNLPVSAVQVAGLDSIIAILAGLAIFPALFALGNITPENVPGGFGLLFYTFPQVFLQMFGGNVVMAQIFASFFFLLILIAALTSSISLLEVVTAYFVDERGWARKRASIILGGMTFLIGIPSALFPYFRDQVVGKITYDYMLPIGGMFISIFAGWIWGKKRALIHIADGCKDFRLAVVWIFSLKWFVPFIIFQILLGKILADLSGYGIYSVPQEAIDFMQMVFSSIDAVMIVGIIIAAIVHLVKPPRPLADQ